MPVSAALLLAISLAHAGAAWAEEAGGAVAPDAAAVQDPSVGMVVVTGTRTARPLRDTPATVTVLPRQEIDRSPTKTTDELLRAVPSFGLFRRSSSVAADPSSQGVNLRGVGPSAVSRSLVLMDGIPANDPFGGWVYWRALPRLGMERIEVVPGGGSALYGNYALGGVTQIISRPITSRSLDAIAEYGSFDTYQVGFRATDRRGPVGVSLEAEALSPDGYRVVAPYMAGPVDSVTPSWHGTANARLEAQASRDLSLTFRTGYFYEDQNGGTEYTTAAVRRLEYVAGARYTPASIGALDLTVFGHSSKFDQMRARITPDPVTSAPRSEEEPNASQEVPAQDVGATAQWTARPFTLGGSHTFTVGSDVRWIAAETAEDLFPPDPVPAAAVVRRVATGTQWLYGVFTQDEVRISDAVALDLAVRYDSWADGDASRVETTSAGTVTPTPFPRRSDHQVSPKAGLRLRPADWLTLRASAYRSFRAPTMNELYRPFQVGQVRTQANENLGPETLTGGEAGLEVLPAPGVTTRVTGFWNLLADPIANVTLDPANPNLRQRQNLGQARIRGIEAEAGWRWARAWVVTAAYTFVDNEVTEAPGQPQLVGKQLPQDPRHRATASLAYDDRRHLAAVAQVRYTGNQYEDDLNAFPMGEAMVVDVSVSPRITRNTDLVFAVENLFDERYLVGRAGVDTVGQPRFVHGGVRVRFGP